MINEYIYLIAAYLIGAIPTGYLIARWCGVQDIRQHGSGNIGATNVARILGVHYFFLIFFLDSAKAYLAIYYFYYLGLSDTQLAQTACMLLIGNGFSIFLGGRGGKGAASSFGVLSALHPLLLCYAAVVWLLVLKQTRTVGMATVLALISLPMVAMFWLHDAQSMIYLVWFITLWGLWLHRGNIRAYYRMIA